MNDMFDSSVSDAGPCAVICEDIVVMKPAISVVLPVYNAMPYLPLAVASMQRQRGVELEIICVDDGSSDGSVEWLRTAARSDARLRLVEQPHRGIVHALNAGLAAARHPVIARMDADDVSHPERLRLQWDLLQSDPALGVVGARVRSFPVRAVSEAFYRYERWSNALITPEQIERALYIESPVVHPSAMYRRDDVLALGGYRDAAWAEDYDLWFRFHYAGYRFAKVPRVLVGWRMLDGRLSFRDPRCSWTAFVRCKAHFLARDPRLRTGPVYMWGAGMTGRRLAKALRKEGVDVRAFIDVAPTKIGRTLLGRPIHGPEFVAMADGFIVVAVRRPAARREIRAELEKFQRREGRDFLFAA